MVDYPEGDQVSLAVGVQVKNWNIRMLKECVNPIGRKEMQPGYEGNYMYVAIPLGGRSNGRLGARNDDALLDISAHHLMKESPFPIG